MKIIDYIGTASSGVLVGVIIGAFISFDVGVITGRVAQDHAAKEDAKKWAKSELIRSCPAWFDDSRAKKQNRVMACIAPDWMK